MTVGSEQRAASSKRTGDRMIRAVLVFFCLLPVVFLPAGSAAQPTGKVVRIGILDPSTASGSAVRWEVFWQELRKLGSVEGKNITIEYRFADQKSERLREPAADSAQP